MRIMLRMLPKGIEDDGNHSLSDCFRINYIKKKDWKVTSYYVFQVTHVLEGHAALTLRSRLRCILIKKQEEEQNVSRNFHFKECAI